MIIKQNDRRPYYEIALTNRDGTPVDLTDAIAVRFTMKLPDEDEAKVDRAECEITDPDAGVAEYRWAAGDTDTPGTYHAEFEVEWAEDEPETFPANGYLRVRVRPELSTAQG